MLLLKDDLYAQFWIFTAVVALLFNSMFGAIAALLFLISGAVVFISNINRSIQAMKSNWLVFLLPIFALFSAMWSDIPLITSRGAIQLILTTVVAVVIACHADSKLVFQAMLFAFLAAMVMSLFSSRMALNGMTGEVSLIGIFGSKNYLSLNTAMSVFVGITILSNKTHHFLIRILATGLVVVSVAVLLKAQSLGALVFVILSLLFSVFIYIYQNMCLPVGLRLFINWAIVLIFIITILFVMNSLVNGGFDEFMYSVGKDPTLTGRTYIWERGLDVSYDNPFLGVGFQSLFYVGNDVAEDIWEFAHVPSGAGFNFHNMYVDTLVELGSVGLIIFLFVIISYFRGISRLSCIKIGSTTLFSIFIFIYMFLHAFLEAGWLGQFTIAHLLTCMAWVYLKGAKPHEL